MGRMIPSLHFALISAPRSKNRGVNAVAATASVGKMMQRCVGSMRDCLRYNRWMLSRVCGVPLQRECKSEPCSETREAQEEPSPENVSPSVAPAILWAFCVARKLEIPWEGPLVPFVSLVQPQKSTTSDICLCEKEGQSRWCAGRICNASFNHIRVFLSSDSPRPPRLPE